MEWPDSPDELKNVLRCLNTSDKDFTWNIDNSEREITLQLVWKTHLEPSGSIVAASGKDQPQIGKKNKSPSRRARDRRRLEEFRKRKKQHHKLVNCLPCDYKDVKGSTEVQSNAKKPSPTKKMVPHEALVSSSVSTSDSRQEDLLSSNRLNPAAKEFVPGEPCVPDTFQEVPGCESLDDAASVDDIDLHLEVTDSEDTAAEEEIEVPKRRSGRRIQQPTDRKDTEPEDMMAVPRRRSERQTRRPSRYGNSVSHLAQCKPELDVFMTLANCLQSLLKRMDSGR